MHTVTQSDRPKMTHACRGHVPRGAEARAAAADVPAALAARPAAHPEAEERAAGREVEPKRGPSTLILHCYYRSIYTLGTLHINEDGARENGP